MCVCTHIYIFILIYLSICQELHWMPRIQQWSSHVQQDHVYCSGWMSHTLLLEKFYLLWWFRSSKMWNQQDRLEGETKGKCVHRDLAVPRFRDDNCCPRGGQGSCASTCLCGRLSSLGGVSGITRSYGCFHGWNSGEAGSKLASQLN